MNKNVIRVIIVVCLSMMMYALKFFPNELVLSTLFTVASIFLSIGLSIIITFDFSTIKNDEFYHTIKRNIDSVRQLFLVYFGIMTLSYLAGMHFIKSKGYSTFIDLKFLSFSINFPNIIICITFSLLLFGICCFIINFIDLQKLKNDIDSIRRTHKLN